MAERTRLAVRIDGAALGDEEARALWKEFSEHMDAHEGDFVGFARGKGWVSVAPEYLRGQAVLVVSTGAPPAGGGAKAAPKR